MQRNCPSDAVDCSQLAEAERQAEEHPDVKKLNEQLVRLETMSQYVEACRELKSLR